MKQAKTIWLLPLLAAALISAAATAGDDAINADRPGIADGSAVVGKGRFQIETGLQQEFRNRLGEKKHTILAPTLLRLGLSEAWEMRIESNVHAWERVTAADGEFSKSSASTPISLGAKYRFWESDDVRPALGMIARVFPPSGSGGSRTRHTTGDVRLVADWDFAPDWSLNPNIGVARYEDGAGKTFSAGLFAVTLSYSVNDKLNVFLDGAAQTREQKNGKSMTVYDAGLAYLLTPDTQLDLSVGIRGSGDTPANQFIGAGISVRF